ncbi:MAG: mechanosensitive ion channel [Desulfobacterales bacterium]
MELTQYIKIVERYAGDFGNFLLIFSVILTAVLAGMILEKFLSFFLIRWRNRRFSSDVKTSLRSDKWRRALRTFLQAMILLPALPFLGLSPTSLAIARQVLQIWIIGAVALLAFNMVTVVKNFTLSRYHIHEKDNLEARRIYTQLGVIERILKVLIIFLGIAIVLLTFERVRQVGISLLASAGILSIILGFSAQKSLATLFAGIQIALTQPIRIDDVVIVENEWGWIEEITLTYVVVKIWDQRRLVVPITYFIEKPFQNWTRTSAEILGAVFLYADYTAPVEKVRDELRRILDSTPLWDRRVCVLQVTDARERTIELRALVSAESSPAAWDLRCHVREKLIEYLQQNHPESLPYLRVEMEKDYGSSTEEKNPKNL